MTKFFQQGGAAPQQDAAGQMQQQVVQLVQAAMQGDQNAQKQVQQIIEAAKQGNEEAVQIAQMIQQVVEAMKQQARSAKIGAKLAYIHKLRTGVNPDEEIVYEKKGGKLVKKTVKKSCQEEKPAQKECKGGAVKKVFFKEQGGKPTRVDAKKCYFGGTL